MAKSHARSGRQAENQRLSARERGALKRHAEACIDAFMRSVGYSDPAQRTDEAGRRHFQLGSASGMAFVAETDDDVIFQSVAHIMDLPADRDLTLPLFRELLELNLTLPGGTKVGVRDNRVFAAMTESVRRIGDEDYGIHIHRVMALADAVDDELQEKYQGTTQQRAAK